MKRLVVLLMIASAMAAMIATSAMSAGARVTQEDPTTASDTPSKQCTISDGSKEISFPVSCGKVLDIIRNTTINTSDQQASQQ